MATSFADRLRIGAITAAAVLSGAAALAAGSVKSAKAVVKKDAPIELESGPTDIDATTHLIHLHKGVKITQGELSVSADEATASGLDFNNTKWEFTGKVHIRAESQGDLHSDKANVEFSNNTLARATLSGSPAQFQQTQSTTGILATGHASSIDYDVLAGTVRLSGDAWLFDGPHKMDAPTITYNVRERQIQGDSGTAPGGRVHMTIIPRSDPGSAPAADPNATGTAAKP